MVFLKLYTNIISYFFNSISTESLNYIHNVGFKMVGCVGMYTIIYIFMFKNSINIRDLTVENLMSKFVYYKRNITKILLTDDLDDNVKDTNTNVSKIHENKFIKKKVYDITNYKEKYLDNFDKIIDKKLTQEELNILKSSFVIENTPHGNVIMHWNNEKGSFVYYADVTIPYYALEVVARKYVINNNCKSIYVDMNYEINLTKQKLENKKINSTISISENNIQHKTCKVSENTSNLNIFAKFKKYNTESIKSSVIVKDSSTKQTINAGKSSSSSSKQLNNLEEMIIKENANRYSYEGKIANFSFLKKVDKKLVDKKYTISFTDFKFMKKQGKINKII